MMKRIWREPLIHFALLGAGLFMANAAWERAALRSDCTITVSPDELERQAVIFAGENRRQPTDEDLRALLFAHVEEQALMREAQRLGLGDDDTIIRRRLAQKMRFMIENVDALAPPSDQDLKEWFKENKAQFVKPERRGFAHIYLSPDSRAEAINENAEELLLEITDSNWKFLGDPFMMKREFGSVSASDAERMLGKSFAKSLFALEGIGDWQGPISSAFGLHLIRIDSIKPSSSPNFEDVKDQALAVWSEEMQREKNAKRLKTLIGKYKVDLEGAK